MKGSAVNWLNVVMKKNDADPEKYTFPKCPTFLLFNQGESMSDEEVPEKDIPRTAKFLYRLATL